MEKRRAEQGNVILLVVMVLPILMLFLSLGIDVSHAHSLGVMQKRCLDDAAEEVQMRQEEVKFSDDPAGLVKDLTADALEREGYVGRVKISYFERTALRRPGSHENDERHIVVEVAAGQGAGFSFLPGGPAPVTGSVVWTMRPYASYRVFRPKQIPEVNGATYGRWFELVFEANGSGRSSGSVVGGGALSYGNLSSGAARELNRLGQAGEDP